MKPEQWHRVKEVFEAALERAPSERSAFLGEACAGDELLRSEVKSLLSSYEQESQFMETPAAAMAAQSLVKEESAALVGQQLGHYQIIRELGRGGMGVVHLAQDISLGRSVALKLLPTHLTSDPDRLRRFRREARAASALNHPNILTIHEIGYVDGFHFIATEFIDGVTLRERIKSKELKLSESLDIAIQIATGLAVAHAGGIIHRDIKPANVMLRSDGLVKILDFGLAKLTERPTIETDTEALMRSLAQTGSGMIMGTVAYMSPEQARGLALDARTDIWTLGVVLYEMVAGQPPFSGPTPSDLLVSILEREPPPVAHKLGEALAELERILRKALKKDREERYQVVKDMALDMKSLSQELKHEAALEHAAMPPSAEAQIAAGPVQAAVATNEKLSARTDEVSAARSASSADYFVSEIKRHKRTTWLIPATIVIVAAGIVFWYKLSSHNQAIVPLSAKLFQRTNMTKLTTNGNAVVANISPNGKYVAYATFERPSSPPSTGKTSLWIRQVTTAGNIQIVRPAEVWYRSVAFSPDGDYVFYVITDAKNAAAVYRVPVLGQGGSPMKVLGGDTSGVSLSPNGKQITFVRHDPAHKEARLMVADADGTNEQILATRKWPESFSGGPFNSARPAWSPDGKVIACSVWVTDSQGLISNVLAVNVADRVEKLLSPDRWNEVGDVSWLSDGSGLLMNAKGQGASFWQVWLLSYPRGESRRITGDLSDYNRSVSLTADSTALVTLQEQTISNIWISPNGHGGRATEITSGAGRYFDLSWTPDGQILYASDASGSAEIWEIGPDGTGAKQLTAGVGRNYGPVASPDGRYVIFHSNRQGSTWHIWRMNADGSNPKQLTSGNTESNYPQISPDGRWVVYTLIGPTGAETVSKVSIDGGTPVQLTDKESLRPSISPDGKMIACWLSDDQTRKTWRIALIPLAGGPPVKVLEVPPDVAYGWDAPLLWSPDGRAVTYRDRGSGVNNIWSQPIDGGKPTQLTDFKSDQIFSFNWSRDGKLVLSRGVFTSDVVMISDSP